MKFQLFRIILIQNIIIILRTWILLLFIIIQFIYLIINHQIILIYEIILELTMF